MWKQHVREALANRCHKLYELDTTQVDCTDISMDPLFGNKLLVGSSNGLVGYFILGGLLIRFKVFTQ